MESVLIWTFNTVCHVTCCMSVSVTRFIECSFWAFYGTVWLRVIGKVNVLLQYIFCHLYVMHSKKAMQFNWMRRRRESEKEREREKNVRNYGEKKFQLAKLALNTILFVLPTYIYICMKFSGHDALWCAHFVNETIAKIVFLSFCIFSSDRMFVEVWSVVYNLLFYRYK